MSRLTATLLGALCGAALVLAFAPFDVWPLSIAAAGGLYWLLERQPRESGWIGLGFGLGKFGFGASWVYVSIHVYGNAPPPLAAFLVLLMVLILSLFPWLQCVAYGRLRRQRLLADVALFALLWVLAEWLMTWVFSGFPWLFIGYAHLSSPLIGYAPIGGVLLVSLMVVLCSSLLVVAFSRQRWAAAAAVVLLVGIGWLGAAVEWTEAAGSRQAALVQGNTPQASKWQRDQVAAIIRNHLDLTEPHWGADVVVWPEAAITVAERDAGAVLEGIDRRARAAGSAFVTGIPAVEREANRWKYHNAAIALGVGQGRYIKQHLVPFGEYVPFEALLRGTIAFFDLPMSSMEEGPPDQPPLTLGGFSGALVVCYEIAFGELVRRHAGDAALLLTLSNDTWFGSSIGPAQHMQIARMRAVELGRSLLRATNNGVTAVVDHRGRVTARLPQFVADVLVAEFELRRGVTPYQRVGYWPVGLLGLLLLLVARRGGA